jgi:acyl homoserine lactone synthase
MYIVENVLQCAPQILKLRNETFSERLGWKVKSVDGQERDEFDELSTTIHLAEFEQDKCVSCCRLMPTTRPNMVSDVFDFLLGDTPVPRRLDIWEISRFAVARDQVSSSVISNRTSALLCGLLEFGLIAGLRTFVAVIDVRMERIIRMAGWPLKRLCQPQRIEDTRALVIKVGINAEILATIKKKSGISSTSLSFFLPSEPLHKTSKNAPIRTQQYNFHNGETNVIQRVV